MKRTLLGALGTALGGSLLALLSRAALPTATDVAAKWSRNAQAATQDYTDGVQRTDVDPTQLAIAAGPRYIARVTEAYNSGKWANALRRIGKAGWQTATLDKAGNYGTGIQKSESKVAAAFGPLLAYEATVQSRINSMPNVTLQDRINRAAEWIRQMAAYVPPA